MVPVSARNTGAPKITGPHKPAPNPVTCAHTVRRGEALSRIAVRYKVSRQSLIDANRLVNPAAFLDAPRFATGSLPFNIGGDEVPIVAHKKEVIGTPDQMQSAFGGRTVVQDNRVFKIDARGATPDAIDLAFQRIRQLEKQDSKLGERVKEVGRTRPSLR